MGQSAMGTVVKNPCHSNIIEIGLKARRALLEEVYTTPKPGLVDLYSCGAHRDMNVTTFEKSAETLYPYFIQMAVVGYETDVLPEVLFQLIRAIGTEAEHAMYCATGGVNTHKGLLFTVGVLSAAAGRCMRMNGRITEKALFETEQQMTAKILTEEILKLRDKEPLSHGEENMKMCGTAGIRGEAILGYPSVRYIALPVLRQGIRERREWNRIKLQTLFCLMSEVEDSNIIFRHDQQMLNTVHIEAKEFLRQGGAYAEDSIQKLMIMDKDYIYRNISAGGCADLLAATIFISLLCDENSSEYNKMMSGSKGQKIKECV